MTGRGFATVDNPNHKGKTDTWLTPLSLVNALGAFDLDPCGFPGHETARRLICLPENGLTAKWEGRVWLNPPYGKQETSKIDDWLKKLVEHENGIACVYSRTSNKWWHRYADAADLIFFLQGRVTFLTDQFTTLTNGGHGTALLAYGRNNAGALLSSGLNGSWR